MRIVKAKGGAGTRWFGCGWKLFREEWGVWLLMTLVLLVLAVAVNLVPLVGPLAATVLFPVILGGFFLAAERRAAGQPVEIGMLFDAFRDNDRLYPLMTLGAIQLGAEFLLGLLTAGILGPNLMETSLGGGALDPVAMFTPGTVLGLLAVLLLGVLLTMALLYAVPLVTLGGVAPVQALKLSFRACLANLGGLTVFGLIYTVLALLAMIPAGLGFLVLVPLTVLAIACGYREVFIRGGDQELAG